ncbi:MAG TPA: cysteine synthase, partial [Clostridium sp.]|nr:cysteine synthase [Clostridium sp.]
MKYLDSVKELIGNTPIIKLNNLGIKPRVSIFAKLENYNPGGSVKDRIGVYMIKQAEQEGRL